MNRVYDIENLTGVLSVEDARAMVALLSATNCEKLSRLERVRRLCDGFNQLVDGDVWIWWFGRQRPSTTTYQVIDGGYASDAQRKAFHTWATLPEMHAVFSKVIVDRMTGHTVVMHHELLRDPDWVEGVTWRTLREQTGLRDFVICLFPLEDGACMALGIHRSAAKPNFTQRERNLMEVVTGEWSLLRDAGRATPAEEKVSALSPRLKQVLTQVLTGSSRKEIARNLAISEHTVGGYLKDLHSRMKVNSRAELMAHFMPGAEPAPVTDE